MALTSFRGIYSANFSLTAYYTPKIPPNVKDFIKRYWTIQDYKQQKNPLFSTGFVFLWTMLNYVLVGDEPTMLLYKSLL
jgi:hypothetical protein